MRAIILHNLAVINYCEIMDHNDRVESGAYQTDDMEMFE